MKRHNYYTEFYSKKNQIVKCWCNGIKLSEFIPEGNVYVFRDSFTYKELTVEMILALTEKPFSMFDRILDDEFDYSFVVKKCKDEISVCIGVFQNDIPRRYTGRIGAFGYSVRISGSALGIEKRKDERFKNKTERATQPEYLQRSARHPYSGGGVSPK